VLDLALLRYPAICAEIFIADPDKMLGVLSSNKDLLDKVFSFFKRPDVHLLVANMVIKLLGALLASKTAQIVAYLKSDGVWLQDCVAHLEAAAVHEWLIKLVALDASHGMLAHLINSKLPDLLVAAFAKERSIQHPDVVQGVTDLLGSVQWDNALVQALASKVYVDKLFQAIFDKSNVSALRYAPRVLIALLKLLNVANQPAADDPTKRLFPAGTALKDLPVIVQIVVANVPQLLALLKQAPLAKHLKMQDNTSVEVFGPHRVVVLELVRSAARLS